MHGLPSSSRCSICLSYPDSVQKECCIRSCVHFADKLFIPSDCDCIPESPPFQSGPSRQHACPHFQSTASLPELLDFGSDGNERIVISRVGIPLRSIFGPLIGHDNFFSNSQQVPTGTVPKSQPGVLDNQSNWMKFVRTASVSDQINLTVVHYEGGIYFAVNKEISVGEELRLGMEEKFSSNSADDQEVSPEVAGEHSNLKVEDADTVEILLPVGPHLGSSKGMGEADINFKCSQNRRRSSRVATSIKKKKEIESQPEINISKALPDVRFVSLLRSDTSDLAGKSSCSAQNSPSANLPKMSRKSGKTKNQAAKPLSSKSPETAPEMSLKRTRMRDCPCCDMKFLFWAEFEDHVLTHSVDGKFPCRVCRKLLSSISSVRRHMGTEHSSQTFYCGQCQWVGKAKISLQDHTRTKHGKIVRQKCPHCERTFDRAHRMRLHISRAHQDTPWKPKRVIDNSYEGSFYKCRDCELPFVRRNDLVDHLNTHHPDVGHHTIPVLCLPYKKVTRYSCGSCQKTAFSEEIIRHHYDEKHGDDAELKIKSYIVSGYVCEICQMPFVGGKCFMSHVRSSHPEYVKVLGMDDLD